MNDNEKSLLNRLKLKLTPLDNKVKAPESLSAESIFAQIESPKPKAGLSLKKRVFTLSTAAAVLIASVIGISIINAGPKTNSQVVVTEVKKYTAADYKDIYKAINALQQNDMREGYKYLYGGSNGAWDDVQIEAAEDATASFAAQAPTADLSSGARQETGGGSGDSSSTNIQVEGVDEADCIKNNDRYIFYFSSNYPALSNKIAVFDAQNPKNLIQFEGIKLTDANPQNVSMFLNGERLTVVWSEEETVQSSSSTAATIINDVLGKEVITPDISFKSVTKAAVYDVSKPESIKLLRSFAQDGYFYNEARMVDNILYLITQYDIYNTINKERPETFVPQVRDSATGTQAKPLEPSCIILPPNVEQNSFVVLSAIDTVNLQKSAETKAQFGGAGTLYASKQNIYLMRSKYENDTTKTEISRFNIGNGELRATGMCTVPGYIINQFAADEYNGYFRIATTAEKYRSDSFYRSNNMFVLDATLNLSGSITDIAPNESIYSVRYQGEKAYMVTFRQTDPLFAIDLSDPRNPKITGQLKIPGFSNYLHPLEGNLMLGIGQDADEDTGRTKAGVKISLFDVSNPEQPLEKDVKILLSDYSYAHSAAAYDHKTFVDLGNNLYGLPVIGEKYDENNYEKNRITSAFAVIALSGEKLEQKALIQNHKDTSPLSSYYPAGIRGVKVSGALITLEGGTIKATDLQSFTELYAADIK
ncbi:MAG: beta-propeller domain-containing protein [Oscillospiraceae bacterium]|jgi:uncharacterized secreted protein with C-terminal beta-propeller domain|nr:beta-propeller domain-containing protein [Oscillospiraceae bacterium]